MLMKEYKRNQESSCDHYRKKIYTFSFLTRTSFQSCDQNINEVYFERFDKLMSKNVCFLTTFWRLCDLVENETFGHLFRSGSSIGMFIHSRPSTNLIGEANLTKQHLNFLSGFIYDFVFITSCPLLRRFVWLFMHRKVF